MTTVSKIMPLVALRNDRYPSMCFIGETFDEVTAGINELHALVSPAISNVIPASFEAIPSAQEMVVNPKSLIKVVNHSTNLGIPPITAFLYGAFALDRTRTEPSETDDNGEKLYAHASIPHEDETIPLSEEFGNISTQVATDALDIAAQSGGVSILMNEDQSKSTLYLIGRFIRHSDITSALNFVSVSNTLDSQYRNFAQLTHKTIPLFDGMSRNLTASLINLFATFHEDEFNYWLLARIFSTLDEKLILASMGTSRTINMLISNVLEKNYDESVFKSLDYGEIAATAELTGLSEFQVQNYAKFVCVNNPDDLTAIPLSMLLTLEGF